MALPGAGPRRVRPGGESWRRASRPIAKKASASARRLNRSAGGPQVGRRCPVDKRRGRLERRVTLERLETRFGPDYLATIPTRRFSMFNAIRSAPGMSPTSPSSGTVNTRVLVRIRRQRELVHDRRHHLHLPCAGVSRAEPSVDVIQEVHVQSIGASVEFGNIQGAVINVVTKQGGSVRVAVCVHGQAPD